MPKYPCNYSIRPDVDSAITNLVHTYMAELVFIVNVYECLTRKQDFKQVQNAFVRLVDMSVFQAENYK